MKKIFLSITLIKRNVRWIIFKIQALFKQPEVRVLDFKMNLNLSRVGLDIMERDINKQLALDSVREKEATMVMQDFIEPGDILLEAGANIGYYVLLESTILSGNGAIYAVEPEPTNVSLLKSNIALNSLETEVDVYQLAFSNTEGELPLYVTQNANLHSFVKPEKGEYHTLNIPVTTIDIFMRDKPDINFIRMDIEGYECKVVDGMNTFLNSSGRKKLFIELHPQLVSGDEMRHLLSRLYDSGFNLYKLISRDTYIRSLLGQTMVEEMALENFINDERLLKREMSFEAFFVKG